MDFFLVGLIILKNPEIFGSVIGIGLPFAFIFLISFGGGVWTERRRSRGQHQDFQVKNKSLTPMPSTPSFAFGIKDAFLDLTDLFGDRDLLGTDLCALPLRLTAPYPIFVIQQSHPFLRALIS